MWGHFEALNVKLQLTFKQLTLKRKCLLLKVSVNLTNEILRKFEKIAGKT